ncbi:MAG: IS4/IS5 family transposase [Dehalococcoidia bacterium]|nr:IS4/IS5 family transposase [Dehalococcoidia bacterium]
MVFACTLKVFEGFSSRRFMSALREAQAGGFIEHTPHFNSINGYLADPAVTPVLAGLVRASAMPLAGIETSFAIDSTGFGTGRFQRWYTHRYGRETERREWVKLHAMIGVETLAVTAAEVTNGNANESPRFIPLIGQTPGAFDVQEVLADRGYMSRSNLRVALQMGISPLIPEKVNVRPPVPGSVLYQLYHQFAFNRDAFLARYHQRSNVESAFSAIKRKFGDGLRTKSFDGNVNETLAKVICHNLSVVIRTSHTLNVEPVFRAGLPAAQEFGLW